MAIRAVPLEFYSQGGLSLPKNAKLHQAAVKFAEKELAEMPDFSGFNKVWLVGEFGEDEPVIQGALGFTMRPDFVLNRFLNPEAILVGYERANDFLADNGCMGQEVLIHMAANETPEQRCPQGLKTVLDIGARPADRWRILVK